VQSAGGFGCCARRFIEQEIDLWQRRQAFRSPDFAHVADERTTAQHGHCHPRESRRLQTSNAVANARDPPSQA